MWKTCFMHILSKGQYPLFSHRKDNILLVQPEIHVVYDHGTRDKLFKMLGEELFNGLLHKRNELLMEYDKLENAKYGGF